MSKRFAIARLVAGGALLITAASADAAPVARDQEIQASAGVFHRQGSDVGTVSGDVSYGYFFVPWFEAGIRQTGNYAFIDNARDQWILGTEPFFDFHYVVDPDQVVVPYVGGFIGAVYNDIQSTGTLGPNVGLKIFLSPQTFFNVAYRYEWFWDGIESGGLTDEVDHGNHVGTFGIGYLFGGEREQRVSVDTTTVTRVENAASRTEQAADRTSAAADRVEHAAGSMDQDFRRGLLK
ncbi:MAG TPA: hypothetical protein VFD92_08590 [Candidatus Binatia bacterium]|nr:hypothetical protein [Candidatus Binatia bacterium]